MFRFIFSSVRFALIMLLLAMHIPGVLRGRKGAGTRLANALTSLGPTYIKLGQSLSIRQDMLGEHVANELAILRDNLPPFSYHKVSKIIQQEFGRPIADLFESFEETPVAAASIAQVHFATTRDGKKVAVKVLRPNVHRTFARDIAMLRSLTRVGEKLSREMRRMKFREVVEQFDQTVKMELDLRMEAAAAQELKENFAAEEGFYVPEVYWRLTAERVMTMERIEGINIHDRSAILAAGHNTTELVERLWDAFFKQVFRDGLFHADMHPGNVFVDKQGRIAVVDFGIMGRLDHKTRYYLAEMTLSFVRRDYTRAAQMHADIGYIPASQSIPQFAQAIRSIAEPIFGLPQSEISVGRLLMQLSKITRDFKMEMQPQLILMHKTLMMAEGISRGLDPNVNIWKIASPYVEKWTREELGIKGKIEHASQEIRTLLNRFSALLSKAEEALGIPKKS